MKLQQAASKVLASEQPTRKAMREAIYASSPNVKLVKIDHDGRIYVRELRNPNRSRMAQTDIKSVFGDMISLISCNVIAKDRNHTATVYIFRPGVYDPHKFVD